MYERYWLVTITRNYFETKTMVYGTENAMQKLMTEICGFVPRYRGATEKEVEAAKTMKMKIYIA